MRKFIFISLLLGLLSIGAFAQEGGGSSAPATKTVPANFKSDGCSLFPDGCFRECCVEHDKAYYNGGTRKERRQADKLLFKCVARKKGWWHKVIAPMMWAGVRLGGVGFLPTPFRWGFGRKKSDKIPAQQQQQQGEGIKKPGADLKSAERLSPDSSHLIGIKSQ